MTLIVSLNQVGIVRANEILHQARADAALRHETEPRTVSVEVRPHVDPTEERRTEATPGQRRVVDLRV